jgi:hypothetical protein
MKNERFVTITTGQLSNNKSVLLIKPSVPFTMRAKYGYAFCKEQNPDQNGARWGYEPISKEMLEIMPIKWAVGRIF